MRNFQYDKRQFYSRADIVTTYNDLRYGGRSGDYVNVREIETVVSLLPSSGRILDIACGTARILKMLSKYSYRKVGGDYSAEMLKQVDDKSIQRVRLDVFNLPFKEQSFDMVICIRFIFHYFHIAPFLKEIHRVLKRGGVLVCQTYRWSPLAWDIPVPFKIGGKIHIHSDRKMRLLFTVNEFKVVDQKSIFLFSPFIYKYLPFTVVKLLEKIERLIPEALRVDTYWKTVKGS